MQEMFLLEDASMAQDERFKGLETITRGLGERVATIEGRLATPLSTKSPNTVLITMLSVVGIGLIGYLGWLGTQVVDQGKKLTAIEMKLTTLGLQTQASLPQSAFDKALPDIRSAVSTARKEGIGVPPKVIEELQGKLLASNSAAPDFWPTVSEFISYRSFAGYRASVAVPPEWKTGTFKLERFPNCTDSLPKPMTIKEVLSPRVATQNYGVYEKCRFILDSETQDQTLNAILRRNTPLITFKNCVIEYHGGEINLILAWDKEPFTLAIIGTGPENPTKVFQTALSGPSITFENCLFNFSFQTAPPPKGQQFSTTLLAQKDTSSVILPIAR